MQGQRRNTLLPSESQHAPAQRTRTQRTRPKDQAGPGPGSHDNRRAHIDQICMHQQLSRNWQLAAQIGGSRMLSAVHVV